MDPAQEQNTLTVKHLSSPTDCPLLRCPAFEFFYDALVHYLQYWLFAIEFVIHEWMANYCM